MAKPLDIREIDVRLAQLNAEKNTKWIIDTNKLSKEFVFADFQAAFAFMSRCVEWIDKMNHHPDWCNVYNRVTVNLYTHEVGGLTRLDFDLADRFDQCV